MADEDWIRIEVCYALPDKQWLLALNVPADCTLEDAVQRSGLQDLVSGGLPENHRYGIWSKIASADSALRDGDRIEIYRGLIADPKEARRARAKKKAQGEEPGAA